MALKQEIIEAALATKGLSKALPGFPKVEDSWQDGDDLFIKFQTMLIRVEVSALPAELVDKGLLEEPAPEQATMTGPEPETLEAQPKKRKRGK